MLGSWNASPTYIERRAALFNGIPILLDDSKQAKDREFVARMIYDLASGQGKGRGSVGGLRRSDRWSTIVLTTGEQRLVDFTQDGGTRGRVMTLWGGPFGETTRATRYLVNRLPATLEADHGHAGPAFVRHLLQHREQWEAWRDDWRGQAADYAGSDVENPILGRLGNCLGAIWLAAAIAHAADLLPWPYADPVAPVLEAIQRQGHDADRALAAIQDVYGWISANDQAFVGRHAVDSTGTRKMPPGGWFGKWSDQPTWETIAIAPPRLEDFLAARGYDKSVITIWRDRGWLDTGSEPHRLTKKVRLNVEDARGAGEGRCYVITREALEQ
jgi:putative DNA primase/helicase